MKNEIRPLTRKDATSKYFVNWFFNMEDWLDAGATPENFDYDRLTDDGKCINYVYGFFIDNKPEGIIRLERVPNGIFIDMLFVNPEKQNWGIGSELMSYAIDKFGDRYDMYLDVIGLNDGGIRFYDRFGFKKIRPFIHRESGTGAKRRCYTMKRDKVEKITQPTRPRRMM